MNLVKNYLTSGIELSSKPHLRLRLLFINLFGLIAFLTISIFALINFVIGDYIPALLETLVLILIIVSIINIRQTQKTNFVEFTAPLIILIMTLNNFIGGGFNQTGILLMFPYPLVVLFVARLKKGLAWIIILFGVMFSIYTLHLNEVLELPYEDFTIKMSFLSLFIISLLVYIYQYSFEKSQDQTRERTSQLKGLNQQLKKIIAANKGKDKSLKHTLNKLAEKNSLLEDTQKAILNILEDIQDEKLEKDRQTQELQKFKEAVDYASDHIVITDSEGIILYANDAVEEITGFSAKEAIGQTPALWGKQMSDEFYQEFWKQIKIEKKVYEGEIKNKRKNGEIYYAEIHVSPILDTDKNVKAFVGIERDITKEKEIDKMKTEFVSVASHQLRTPLTGIKWFIEVMRDESISGKLNDEQTKYLKSIETSTERMITLVNDLLNVSRIDTGNKFNIEKQKTDIIKSIKEAVEENKILAKDSQIELKFQKDFPKKLTLNIDPDKMFEVFKNLINNAIKYSSQKDSVEIGIKERSNKSITFFIKDEGLGIPEEAQKRIFQKFFRAQNVLKNQTDGSGLGLYIAKAIIEGHDGEISFESEVDKGTTFYIKLPTT